MISIERVVDINDFVDLRRIMRSEVDTDCLQKCVMCSLVVYKGKIDDEVACIWGLVPPTIMSTQAYIWLYTTDIASNHTFVLVRYSQMMIQEMLKDYEALVGHCRVGDDRAIRWIKWLGAEFGAPQGKLVPFTIRRKNG